jgi:putative transposase
MNAQSSGQNFPRRHSLRLPGYDYSQPGAYFVTICTHGRQSIFGDLVHNSVLLSPSGEIVRSCWKDILFHYPGVNNEIFMVMPNHIHGIIVIPGPQGAGLKPAPTKTYPLSEIIRGFKAFSSRRINENRNSQGKPVWQRGYYEHIIRDPDEYHQIGEYILFNPAKWEIDRDNPQRKPFDSANTTA